MKLIVHCLFYGGIVLALAGGLAAVAVLTPKPPAVAAAKPQGPDYAGTAKRLGKQSVLRYLNRPHDAKFNDDARAKRFPDGSWLAGGTVKALNGFGNAVTSEWQVYLFVQGTRMQVTAVYIDGQQVNPDRPDWAK